MGGSNPTEHGVRPRQTTAQQIRAGRSLTFADQRDVDVDAADGEVGVLDLLRHRCLLLEDGQREMCFSLNGEATDGEYDKLLRRFGYITQ